MRLLMFSDILSPSQVAQYLRDNFGYAVTSFVIVKWDNLILRKRRLKNGDKLRRRAYSFSDLILFNGIAVMRNLGYSIDDIRKVFDMDLRNDWTEKECLAFVAGIKNKIAKQKEGLDLYGKFFEALKNRNRTPLKNEGIKRWSTRVVPPSGASLKTKKPRTPIAVPPGIHPKPKVTLLLKPATSEQIAKRKEQL